MPATPILPGLHPRSHPPRPHALHPPTPWSPPPQELGETLTGVIRSMSDELAARHAASPSLFAPESQQQQSNAGQTKLRRAQGQAVDEPHKSFFFSLGGKLMVVYSLAAAQALHPVPLVLGLSLPWALAAAAPQAALAPGRGLAVAAGSAGRALGSLLLAPALTGAFGVARVLITGARLRLVVGGGG